MKPEDLLPDDQDCKAFGGETVRKGTVGAFLANAKIVENGVEGSPEYNQAIVDLAEALPKLRALGLFDFFELKPSRIRKVIERML